MEGADTWNRRSYKQEQEDFVSNYGGDFPNEVLMIFVPNITSILLTSLTLALFDSQSYKNIQFFVQFVLIVVPAVLCLTLLSDQLITVSIAMYIMILLVNFLSILDVKLRKTKPPRSTMHNSSATKITIITNFRAMTNLLTAICILGVDFPVFPRKFAKTENSGYSLMDTGVGLFVVSNALVSPEARFDTSSNSPNNKMCFAATFLKNLRGSVILILLGIGRAVAIEYLDYQRHVSEYGIHWNFFITLAFIKVFSSLVLGRISSKYSFVPGLWLLVMHEYVLSNRGFKEWILGYASRDNFISANREGLVSLPGYVGLYLCAVSIGKLVNSSYRIKENYKLEIFKRKFELSPIVMLFIQLFLIAGTANAVTFLCEEYFGVSRRLVNFGYAAWIITISALSLTYLMLVDAVMNSVSLARMEKDPKKKSLPSNTGYSLEIFEAINYNGLFFFLIANILTGLINMSIKTLYVNSLEAVRILIGYIGINILTVLFLYRSRIQLKI